MASSNKFPVELEKQKFKIKVHSILGRECKKAFRFIFVQNETERVETWKGPRIYADETEYSDEVTYTAIRFDSVAHAGAYQRTEDCMFEQIAIVQHEENVYLLGLYVGTHVSKWIHETDLKLLWERDKNGKAVQPGPHLAQFGKSLATILWKRHSLGSYVGGLFDSLFVEPETSKATLVCLNKSFLDSTEGIKQDLKNFKELVAEIGNLVEDGLRSDDLKLFYELFDDTYATTPTMRLDARDRSYIICHFPLFWEFEQRHAFAHFFYDLGKRHDPTFKNVVKLESGTRDARSWHSKLLSLSKQDVLYQTYTYNGNNKTVYSRAVGIMSFHRNVYNHFIERNKFHTLVDIDKQLLSLFPNAYPKAYTELFDKFLGVYNNLVEEMKESFLALNYASP